MKEERIKILDVGCGPESVAAKVFADANPIVYRLDADPAVRPDFVHDITQPFPKELQGQFDIVYASHVLEHIERAKVMQTFYNFATGLKELGELWVIVPSLEFAADAIRKGTTHPALQGLIFGGQQDEYQFHKSGFTLPILRQLADATGLVTRKAYQAEFTIGVGGKEVQALQDILVAARYGDLRWEA